MRFTDIFDIASMLSGALSQAYINYFDYMGCSYQVIPQIDRDKRQNASQLLNYYINTAAGTSVSLSTVASLLTKTVLESLNHFQQLNSATISGVAFPGVTVDQALDDLAKMAQVTLPAGYSIDYAGSLITTL